MYRTKKINILTSRPKIFLFLRKKIQMHKYTRFVNSDWHLLPSAWIPSDCRRPKHQIFKSIGITSIKCTYKVTADEETTMNKFKAFSFFGYRHGFVYVFVSLYSLLNPFFFFHLVITFKYSKDTCIFIWLYDLENFWSTRAETAHKIDDIS